MILIGIGANLTSRFGTPRETCEAAVAALADRGLILLRRSRWYRTAPVPLSDQPWYANGVAAVAGPPEPEAVLAVLADIEDDFGRRRTERNAARVIDLDLLAHGDLVRNTARLELPHPRLHERAFVLLPLAEVAPDWRHPVLGRTVGQLIAELPTGQVAEPEP